MNPAQTVIVVLVALAIWFLLFLLTRTFWCWYFKLNRIEKLLESIDQSLQQLPAVAQRKATP